MPDDGALTGGQTRKPCLSGGDRERNEKTNIFLTGKPRPVGGTSILSLDDGKASAHEAFPVFVRQVSRCRKA
jgi:hypothetical protein